MVDLLDSYAWQFLIYFNAFILFYFLALNLSYLGLVIVSFFYIRRQYDTLNVHDFSGAFKNELFQSYSIIMPAYNEEDEIVETVESLLQQKYGDFEVIVSNDGSTDSTLKKLKESFNLYPSNRHILDTLDHRTVKEVYKSREYPNLVVLDKENGGWGDALNAALNAARKDLYCTCDADSVLEQNVLLKMLRSFAKDEKTIAVGGILRISNGCTFEDGEFTQVKTPPRLVSCFQVIEFIRSFMFGRIGWEYFHGLILVSGAFGVFDRDAVMRVGGYTPGIGTDLELTVKLHHYYRKHDIPYKITYQPEPVCWTKALDNWSALSRQRNRWQRTLFHTLWQYKFMLFNPKYGFVGMVAMPFYFFFELMGPVIELIGYGVITYLLFTGLLPPVIGLLFFIVAILFGTMLSVTSLVCDELTYQKYPRLKDLVKLGGVSLIESFGFRQLHTWWRVKGMIEYILGRAHRPKYLINNSKLINGAHWIAFCLINLIIFYLFYYGITNGNQLL